MQNFFERTFTTAFALIIFTTNLHAQVYGTSFQNLTNVGTVSPQAASLGKFGNIPVSYCTGLPSITIPLYNINFGKVNIPLSLDYFAGGVRVDETSSSVGTGWALNGIGVISRIMIGRPDELDYIGSPDAQDVVAAPQNYFPYLYSFKNNQNNADPDIYQYNVNGLSGKFIFRPDGSIMQIPVTNNKITYTGSDFTIIDDKGNTYIFDEKRSTSSSEVTDPSYVSTWCETKMISANTADTVSFSYEPNSFNYVNYDQITDFTYTFSHSLSSYNINCGDGHNAYAPMATDDIGLHERFQTITNYEYYPKEIDWRGGKVIFSNVDDRSDITGGGLRLDHLDIYSLNNGVYTFVRRKQLFQSYFISNPDGGTVTEKNKRLRLDSVEDKDINSNNLGQLYQMEYNNGPIAPRGSFAQDRWGYYNGHINNTDLIPKQIFEYKSVYYNFGGADRTADPTAILACTLKSITYPTKGKTVLEMEPHQFHTDLPHTQVVTVAFQNACCGTNSHLQQTFTVASNQSNFRYQVSISPFNNASPAPSQRPQATLTDQTTGQLVFQETTMPTTATDIYYNTPTMALNLTQGHTYLLDVNTYTTDASVSVSEDISCEETIPGANDIVVGGGLRVKSLTNYDIDGNFINKDEFTYGTDNTGKALTPQYYQDINFDQVVHRLGYNSCSSGCSYVDESNNQAQLGTYPGYSTIFHAGSVLPTSQYAGSPVLYPEVTKTEVDQNGNVNGKTVYTYGVYEDGASSPFQPITGVLYNYFPKPGINLINNTWKNGKLLEQETYKSISNAPNFQLIGRQFNHYFQSYLSSQDVLKVNFAYLHTGCEVQGSVNDFNLSWVPVFTGAMLPDSTITSTFDNNGNELDKVQTFTYNAATPLLPSKIKTISSKGHIIIQNLQYPKDLSVSGNVYEKMVNRDIVSPIVTTTQLNNGIQTLFQRTNYYDWLGNSHLLEPQTVDAQISNNPIETRIYFNHFDTYGNILEQQKSDDIIHSYLWDYNSVYPVAEVTNASQADIAYTSFEADSKGNWIFNGTPSPAGGAITGSQSYSLNNGNITKSGLTSATKYIISYWSKGAVTISGGTHNNSITGETVGDWTYHSVMVSGTTSISISGSNYIDELRLYPSNAQMTTFTYEPLVGMTSKCDANNLIAYYNYDDEGRLILIRDQDKNILKKICYNYAGQPGNCNVYFNEAQSGNFTRSCDPNYTGSTVTYTVPAKRYSSPTSVTDANNKAIADVNANGPTYANEVGTCTYNPMITIQGSNSKSSNYQVRFTNNATNNWYTFILNANSSGLSNIGQVPPGTYTVLFYPMGPLITATFNINGYTYYGTGATFYNISITSTSTARMY